MSKNEQNTERGDVQSVDPANAIAQASEIMDNLSVLTEILHNLKLAAYGVNVLDGILGLASGTTQFIQAKDSKRHKNEKRAWGATTAVTGATVLSAEALGTLVAISALTGTVAAGVTLYSGLTFTLGMSVALIHSIRQADKAYQKLDPKYLIEDRIIKYKNLKQKIKKLEKKKKPENATTQQASIELQIKALETAQERLKNQAIALYKNNQEKLQENYPMLHAKLKTAIIKTFKIDNDNLSTKPIAQEKKLATQEIKKQQNKHEQATQNTLLLAIGTVGVGLLTVAPFFPPALPFGIALTGITSAAGLFKLGKTYLYNKIKKNIALKAEKKVIMDNILKPNASQSTADISNQRQVPNVKSLSENQKNQLYNEVGNTHLEESFKTQSPQEKNNILNHLLTEKAKKNILREELGLEKKEDINKFVSKKAQRKIIREHAKENYQLKDVTKFFFQSDKTKTPEKTTKETPNITPSKPRVK